MAQGMDSPAGQQASGNWKQFKGRLREAWGSLTDDELERFQGRREQLEGYIEEKTGEARSAIRRRMDDLATEAEYRF